MAKQASLVSLLCSFGLIGVHSKPAERLCSADATDISSQCAHLGSRHGLLQVNVKGQGQVEPQSEVHALQEPVCRINEARANLDPRQDSSYQDYHEMQGGQQGLFVYPPKKFAICLIEKNACSTWIANVLQPLLQSVTTVKTNADDPDSAGAALDYSISGQSQRYFGVEGMNAVFQDPTATRVVFVREPLERFASTFLDKCMSTSMPNRANCPMDGQGEQITRFSELVEWAINTNLSGTINGHWMAQASHCQLQARLEDYNIIGLMEPESLERDMNCILKRAGLEGIKIEKPKVNKGVMNTMVVLQKLFTPEAARRLIDHMKLDYELFGFPTPSWVAGATGEWYDVVPMIPAASIQTGASKEGSKPPSAEDDTDDLVELAYRAGYGRFHDS
mmetsp:Transcript_78519/g.139249  ORF Transcript_78519/g.139249 Transcript_78519/m.139249 type:complete len:391 (+) Transcript_78519:76-1248(+)